MSMRKRKQQGLAILILSLFVALVAGSAGFATGYGADAAKRTSLSEEVAALKAQTENAPLINEELEALKAENETLKAENEELTAKVTEFEEALSDLKDENEPLKVIKESEGKQTNEAEGVLDPVERSDSEGNGEAKSENVPSATRVSLVDKITKYVIIVIVAILVLMGLCMIFIPHREDEDEDAAEDFAAPKKEAPESAAEAEKAYVPSQYDAVSAEPTKEIVIPSEDEEEKKEAENYDSEGLEETEKEKEEAKDVCGAEESANTFVPDTLEELMAQSPSAVRNDD